MGQVTVEDRLHERMGTTVVIRDGSMLWLPKGELAAEHDIVVAQEGEPGFRLQFTHPVLTEADLPDDVGLALAAAAARFQNVLPDGSEVASHDDVDWGNSSALPRAEWVTDPTIRADGTVTISMDTDDAGYTRAMISTMVDILRGALEPLIDAEIGAEREVAGDSIAWRQSTERIS